MQAWHADHMVLSDTKNNVASMGTVISVLLSSSVVHR